MDRRPVIVVAALLLTVPPGGVSHITDSRIKESSGLTISSTHEDLAYTINDAGNPPIVYAIRVSTGDVVGTTRVDGGDLKDTESIAIDGDGTVWLADLGDNTSNRSDAALYAFPEPGPGDHEVTAKRYPVTYDGGPRDVEALLVHPQTGAKLLASKEKKRPGTLFALPKDLTEDRPNVASDLNKPVPEKVSDATFTTDGSEALLRTQVGVHVFDPGTWREIREIRVPDVKQGESIAMEPTGSSFIIGSEGKNSPLIRVSLRPKADAPVAESSTKSEDAAPTWLLVAGALAVLAAAAVIGRRVSRRR
jgi:hypothetical protein